MSRPVEGRTPAVSLVMPVYNASATVGESIESVLSQTMGDLELICVDDGSTDGSRAVLEGIVGRDARVRVIAQKNAGPSAARNTGLDAARGRIICTIDADDALVPEHCARLVETFERTGAEVVVFGAVCEPEDAASERIRELLSPRAASYASFAPELLFSAHAQPYAWRAAWTRSLEERERVRFPEGVRLGEDAAFLFTLYPVAHGIELIPDKLYRYRMVGGSLTHALDDPSVLARKVAQHLGAFEAIFAEWSRRGLESLCPAQMVTWCLDMTAFDLVRLPAKEGAAAVARLAQTLADVYGEAWAELPRQQAVRRTARRIADAAAAGTGPTLGNIDIMRFFLATRGLRACVQRVLR